MKRYAAYLFDLDGTLYRGGQAIPYARETLADLRQGGARVRFLTNNSGVTPEGIATKLNGMAIEAHPEEVVTSGMAAARILNERKWRNLFVIGEPGLVEVLRRAGLNPLNADPDGRVFPQESAPYDAVVCGICRSFTYDLLNSAHQAIRGGAKFVATNPDTTYPMEGGRLEPGAGSLVAALEICTGQRPILAGKPQPAMIELALENCGVGGDEALIVGDRYDTDILAAENAGCDAVLVLTGVEGEVVGGTSAISDLRGLLR